MHGKRLLKENFVPLLQNDQAAKNCLRPESSLSQNFTQTV